MKKEKAIWPDRYKVSIKTEGRFKHGKITDEEKGVILEQIVPLPVEDQDLVDSLINAIESVIEEESKQMLPKEEFQKEVQHFRTRHKAEAIQKAREYEGRIEGDHPLVVGSGGVWTLILESTSLNWLSLTMLEHLEFINDDQESRIFSKIAEAISIRDG